MRVMTKGVEALNTSFKSFFFHQDFNPVLFSFDRDICLIIIHSNIKGIGKMLLKIMRTI